MTEPTFDLNYETERLVRREVLSPATTLINKLYEFAGITYDNKYEHYDDIGEPLEAFYGEEDNNPEICEFWIITPWLMEKLQAKGELCTEILDLCVWGRQTAGQIICIDTVIEAIVLDLFRLKD